MARIRNPLGFVKEHWYLIMPVLAIMAVVYVAIALILPFKPLTIYGFTSLPDVTCPGGSVKMNLDSELDPRWHSDIAEIEVFSQWIDTDSKLVDSAGNGIIEIQPYERRAMPSRVSRDIPEIPGTWGLETTYIVYGDVWGVPRTQEFTFTDARVIEVLEYENPRCPNPAPEPVELK